MGHAAAPEVILKDFSNEIMDRKAPLEYKSVNIDKSYQLLLFLLISTMSEMCRVVAFNRSDARTFGISKVQESTRLEVRKFGSSEVWKFGSSVVRKSGSLQVRKFGSSEVRKIGSAKVRKLGSSEVRNSGSLEVRKCLGPPN